MCRRLRLQDQGRGCTECTRLLPLREHACLERIAIILFACCTEAAVVPICSRSTRRCDKSQERRTRTSSIAPQGLLQ